MTKRAPEALRIEIVRAIEAAPWGALLESTLLERLEARGYEEKEIRAELRALVSDCVCHSTPRSGGLGRDVIWRLNRQPKPITGRKRR